MAVLLAGGCIIDPVEIPGATTGDSGVVSVTGTGCPLGSLGCACTVGGSCDPGLECRGDACMEPVEPECLLGVLGCPCTGGGACDPGLVCDGGVCTASAADTTSVSSDGDPTTASASATTEPGTASADESSSGGSAPSSDSDAERSTTDDPSESSAASETGTSDASTTSTTDASTTGTSTTDASTTDGTGSTESGTDTGDLDDIVYASFAGAIGSVEANDDCVLRGGHLATIHTAPQNDAVLAVCAVTPGGAGPDLGCWIGAVAPFAEWVDASAIDYTRWSAGNPSGNGSCLWIYTSAAAANAGEWDDAVCDAAASYVCALPQGADLSGAAAVAFIP